MNLFDKIEWYHKQAQEKTGKYGNIISKFILEAITELQNLPQIPNENKTDIIDSFKGYLSESHPDQDTNWSAQLGKLMDQLIASKRHAKSQQEADAYQTVCSILDRGWKTVEYQGGKAHTSKPLCERWVGPNNELLPTSTSSVRDRMLLWTALS